MKRIKNIHIAAVLILVILAGCKKYEQFPVDKVGIQYVFDPKDSLGSSAQEFLYGIYPVMKSGHNRVGGDYLDAASDDAMSSASGPTNQVTILGTAAYNSYTIPADENLWAYYYAGIRKANIFVNNIGVVPVMAKYKGYSQKYVWKSEARFLRALFYFELVKRYGGVPLLGDKVFTISDNVSLPRNSFADCIKYITSECDAIKDTLLTAPVDNPNADAHRVTKGAALALKARVLLYAASPLFNGGNIDAANPLTGYTDNSLARWAAASAAAKDVMNLGAYSLPNDFKGVFLNQNNSEMILIRQTGSDNGIETANAPIGFPGAAAKGQTSPSQQLVDAFPMSNGLAITDPASGYDSNNPYANRDPRLTYTVFYNGARWLNSDLQLYEGGQSKPNTSLQQTKTGYYMRKFMGNEENANSFQGHNADWLVIRYADVILGHAEAENEVNGATSDVYNDMISIRKRAGIAAGGNGLYGLKAGMTKDEMRDAIHNERRIEFAFEESRYWDIRRWKTANVVMNQPLQGMSINKIGSSLTYNIVTALDTKFNQPAMYLYPIPYDEVLKNPNMKQNPGW
ncbi:RagB/SusD family nutrient uptake outer membrane protein [Mucilaginibacter sp. KACC 22773]|uniref:RagB/SusD family nutrient uptake outer membrane protein n=1 Tax=Mucilaginibacter sp. KACC 22773 TaxID=3025671 RepID=UPI002365366F|nr:RagB/SusD family nutrient uptake outer membrane protein [Mucilaginibacter sp. KACC 22773]WDF80014.1 RagB/SusD family nutrient uptake outer membrane protein [Mucilaginibacter sp. KACC 22773]